MMRNAIVLLGTLSLLACTRDRAGSTTTTGATGETTQGQGTAQQGTATPQQGTGTMQQGQGTTMEHGQGSVEPGQGSMQQGTTAAGAMQQGAGVTHTKNADAVRTHLKQEKVAPAAVISDLVITDDGTMIVLSGTVPDQATHDAVIKSAKKTPGVKGVRDDLKIKGQ